MLGKFRESYKPPFIVLHLELGIESEDRKNNFLECRNIYFDEKWFIVLILFLNNMISRYTTCQRNLMMFGVWLFYELVDWLKLNLKIVVLILNFEISTVIFELIYCYNCQRILNKFCVANKYFHSIQRHINNGNRKKYCFRRSTYSYPYCRWRPPF